MNGLQPMFVNALRVEDFRNWPALGPKSEDHVAARWGGLTGRDDRQRRGIRELKRLEKSYGKGRWRKKKGIARIRFSDGSTHAAEVQWYEAHGVGRKEAKIKRLLGR